MIVTAACGVPVCPLPVSSAREPDASSNRQNASRLLRRSNREGICNRGCAATLSLRWPHHKEAPPEQQLRRGQQPERTPINDLRYRPIAMPTIAEGDNWAEIGTAAWIAEYGGIDVTGAHGGATTPTGSATWRSTARSTG